MGQAQSHFCGENLLNFVTRYHPQTLCSRTHQVAVMTGEIGPCISRTDMFCSGGGLAINQVGLIDLQEIFIAKPMVHS